MAENSKMEKLVSLAKRRGFIFQGSDIYGGLAGTWDYGPFGVALKNNIKRLWWERFVLRREDMYGLDSAILLNQNVWQASGHTGAGFTDVLVECKECQNRFRPDEHGMEAGDASKLMCPHCGAGSGSLTEPRQFNTMFETWVGIGRNESNKTYLRPETAQGMFVNFKNVVDSVHPKFPFGMAQIGKAFRNEIAPREFLYRVREFEQMEIEYFVKEDTWQEQFEYWRSEMQEWLRQIGIGEERVHEVDLPEDERAHYSKKTTDFEYEYPFGQKELYGLAYRTDFDLSSHARESGVDLNVEDPETGEKITPHVIEPTFGLDRTILALLAECFEEEETSGGEVRTVLRFKPAVAPVKVAVFPLLKNKPELVEPARTVYTNLKRAIPEIMWDDHGNVGKRYRRQDEIGTPYCVTFDFDSLEDNSVTVRDRDSMEQTRISIDELAGYLKKNLYG